MNLNLKVAAFLLLAGVVAHAQAYSVKAVLKDSQSDEADTVEFLEYMA